MTDTWQDRIDDTLDRIENQTDSTNKQEGFALNFREKVLTSLTSIEDSLKQNEVDHKEIKESVKKIPAMEIGLNNHLHTHDTHRKYILYPLLVGACLALMGVFCKLVLHLF